MISPFDSTCGVVVNPASWTTKYPAYDHPTEYFDNGVYGIVWLNNTEFHVIQPFPSLVDGKLIPAICQTDVPTGTHFLNDTSAVLPDGESTFIPLPPSRYCSGTATPAPASLAPTTSVASPNPVSKPSSGVPESTGAIATSSSKASTSSDFMDALSSIGTTPIGDTVGQYTAPSPPYECSPDMSCNVVDQAVQATVAVGTLALNTFYFASIFTYVQCDSNNFCIQPWYPQAGYEEILSDGSVLLHDTFCPGTVGVCKQTINGGDDMVGHVGITFSGGQQVSVRPDSLDGTTGAEAWLSFSISGYSLVSTIVDFTGFGGDTCANYPSSWPLHFSSIYSYDQYINVINLNFQENSQSYWGTCGDSMSYTDGTVGTATFSYNPWVVSISSSNSYAPIGGSVTLTASSDIDVGPTPYWLDIVDSTTGKVIANCGAGITCSASVSEVLAGTHNFYAEVSGYDGASPIEKVSSTIAVTWYDLYFSASATYVPVGTSVTLTATTNINVGPTPYYIIIKDSTTGYTLNTCGTGYSCSYSYTAGSPTTQSFYAEITGYNQNPVYLTTYPVAVTWY